MRSRKFCSIGNIHFRYHQMGWFIFHYYLIHRSIFIDLECNVFRITKSIFRIGLSQRIIFTRLQALNLMWLIPGSPGINHIAIFVNHLQTVSWKFFPCGNIRLGNGYFGNLIITTDSGNAAIFSDCKTKPVADLHFSITITSFFRQQVRLFFFKYLTV